MHRLSKLLGITFTAASLAQSFGDIGVDFSSPTPTAEQLLRESQATPPVINKPIVTPTGTLFSAWVQIATGSNGYLLFKSANILTSSTPNGANWGVAAKKYFSTNDTNPFQLITTEAIKGVPHSPIYAKVSAVPTVTTNAYGNTNFDLMRIGYRPPVVVTPPETNTPVQTNTVPSVSGTGDTVYVYIESPVYNSSIHRHPSAVTVTYAQSSSGAFHAGLFSDKSKTNSFSAGLMRVGGVVTPPVVETNPPPVTPPQTNTVVATNWTYLCSVPFPSDTNNISSFKNGVGHTFLCVTGSIPGFTMGYNSAPVISSTATNATALCTNGTTTLVKAVYTFPGTSPLEKPLPLDIFVSTNPPATATEVTTKLQIFTGDTNNITYPVSATIDAATISGSAIVTENYQSSLMDRANYNHRGYTVMRVGGIVVPPPPTTETNTPVVVPVTNSHPNNLSWSSLRSVPSYPHSTNISGAYCDSGKWYVLAKATNSATLATHLGTRYPDYIFNNFTNHTACVGQTNGTAGLRAALWFNALYQSSSQAIPEPDTSQTIPEDYIAGNGIPEEP